MNQLDHYIERQKEITPSPYLAAKIMTGIREEQKGRTRIVWQNIAIAASFALMVALGITLGNTLTTSTYLEINDNHIENLTALITTENE